MHTVCAMPCRDLPHGGAHVRAMLGRDVCGERDVRSALSHHPLFVVRAFSSDFLSMCVFHLICTSRAFSCAQEVTEDRAEYRCVRCEDGTATFPNGARTACVGECEAGAYLSAGFYCALCAPGTGSCAPCPENTYSARPGQAACLRCPAGTWALSGSSACSAATCLVGSTSFGGGGP